MRLTLLKRNGRESGEPQSEQFPTQLAKLDQSGSQISTAGPVIRSRSFAYHTSLSPFCLMSKPLFSQLISSRTPLVLLFCFDLIYLPFKELVNSSSTLLL